MAICKKNGNKRGETVIKILIYS